jgi:hypothetical protein
VAASGTPSPAGLTPPLLSDVLGDDDGLVLCVADALADEDAVWLLVGDAAVSAPQLVSGVALFFFFCVADALALVPVLGLTLGLALVLVLGLTLVLALVLVLTSGLALVEAGGLVVLDVGVTVGLVDGDVLGLAVLVDLAEDDGEGEHDAVAATLACPREAAPSAVPPP